MRGKPTLAGGIREVKSRGQDWSMEKRGVGEQEEGGEGARDLNCGF